MKLWLHTLVLSLAGMGLAHADVNTVQQNLKRIIQILRSARSPRRPLKVFTKY